MELLDKSVDFAKKKKRWVLVLGALGFTGYGAYRVYNLPCVVKKRQRLFKLLGAFISVAEMVSDSAEGIGIVSKDLKEFLGSDSDQIPQSLRQISKIARSDEFSESLTKITRALTVGILRGYQHEMMKNGRSLNGDPGFCDRVMDKLFSDAGSGFASVVVGSFARNLVMALCSEWQQDQGSDLDDLPNADHLNTKSDQFVSRLVEVACEAKCRELIGDCIRLFVSTAVAVYLDKTMNINTYDEIFSGLTNPKHEAQVRGMLVSVCSGAVETLIRTSHHVWTTESAAASKLKSTYSKIDDEDDFDLVPTNLRAKKFIDDNQESGWVRKMSSTLAVPSNRKFVLDMTGTVTFETVRCFLEFLLQKLSECMKRSADVVHEEVVDRGVEAMRYVTGRSSAVTSLCLALCLNILNSPWILAPN
ncbi:protein PHLOEM PROTEIN 2-LIKE A10 [Sesamum alatum]|uniref:Protein PHLOEM PROTEIN 2-LIKE A10 n=1 Tax=Sesamum alatum TaxID=300844 RepID=A0AAE1XRR5_9LAMI|nr:protein PHLOEM PROTEIN 2-LIKE A10 [Sesamum alatum]